MATPLIQTTRSSGVKRQGVTPIRWSAALLSRVFEGLMWHFVDPRPAVEIKRV